MRLCRPYTKRATQPATFCRQFWTLRGIWRKMEEGPKNKTKKKKTIKMNTFQFPIIWKTNCWKTTMSLSWKPFNKRWKSQESLWYRVHQERGKQQPLSGQFPCSWTRSTKSEKTALKKVWSVREWKTTSSGKKSLSIKRRQCRGCIRDSRIGETAFLRKTMKSTSKRKICSLWFRNCTKKSKECKYPKE